MEEIREAALAIYENGSAEQKKLARDFFSCLDVDGDGTMDSQEFISVLTDEGYLMIPAFSRHLTMMTMDLWISMKFSLCTI